VRVWTSSCTEDSNKLENGLLGALYDGDDNDYDDGGGGGGG